LRERAAEVLVGADFAVLVSAVVVVPVDVAVEVAVDGSVEVSIDSGAVDSGDDSGADDSAEVDSAGSVTSVDEPIDSGAVDSGDDWTGLETLGGTADCGPTSAVPPTVCAHAATNSTTDPVNMARSVRVIPRAYSPEPSRTRRSEDSPAGTFGRLPSASTSARLVVCLRAWSCVQWSVSSRSRSRR
jgi:hypothetical protein